MIVPPANDALKRFNAKKGALADRIRHDARLSASTRAIGAEICSLMNFRTGYSWAPEAYLGEKLGMGARTIKRAIAALKTAGYVEVTKVGRNNRYTPIFEAVQVPIWPLSEEQQGPNWPLSGEERGQKQQQQGPKRTENRGQKGPPILLEISLGILTPAATGAVGAPDGAAGPGEFDLGLPGVALRQRLGDDVFRSWLGNVAVVSIGDELVLAAPTRFVATYIAAHFDTAIVDCWRVQHPAVSRMRMVVRTAVTPISTRRPPAENEDARWLVDVGIEVVAERLHTTRASADKTLVGWLQRCGRDVGGLRRIIEQASALDMDEVQFSNVVKQRTKALLNADQTPLPLAPVGLKRSAS